MKKTYTLILTFLFVLLLAGCTKTSYEETEIETTVIQCDEGTYQPNESYIALANTYLAQGNVALYSSYIALANNNGYYSYNITININDVDYVIERSEPYEVGQSIIVTKVETFEDSTLVKTEYK